MPRAQKGSSSSCTWHLLALSLCLWSDLPCGWPRQRDGELPREGGLNHTLLRRLRLRTPTFARHSRRSRNRGRSGGRSSGIQIVTEEEESIMADYARVAETYRCSCRMVMASASNSSTLHRRTNITAFLSSFLLSAGMHAYIRTWPSFGTHASRATITAVARGWYFCIHTTATAVIGATTPSPPTARTCEIPRTIYNVTRFGGLAGRADELQARSPFNKSEQSKSSA